MHRDGLYKLLVIGGGPSGVGILIRAARLGLLARLLDPVKHGTASDVETSARLGFKQLGFGIVHDGDSATFGAGKLGAYVINSNTFAKSLLSSVLDERPELDPPESIKNTFLEDAKQHESTRRLEEIGTAPACLVDFGKFLANVGACALREVAKFSDTSDCLLNTRATKFWVLENGVIRVEVVSSGNRTMVLHTEHLVLALGGKQELPTLENPALMSKVFTSDACLRKEGFETLKDHLLQSKDKKICIVGGSHSSFSVAWLLLNKWTSKTSASPVKQEPGKQRPSVFGPKDITILHRSPIRCYYMTKKDAEADGVDSSRVDRTGCINTFTGLREDSKNLYKDIRAGKETRVRLFQVNPQGCQNLTNKAYEAASAIVWCCGYKTKMIPAFDEAEKPLRFLDDHGVLQLTLTGHLQLQASAGLSKPLQQIMGVGLGFSLRAAVDEMGTETRADGVTVYHRRGASLVLAQLFGPSVYGEGCQTFEEMVEKNDKRKKEHVAAKADALSLKKSQLQQKSTSALPRAVTPVSSSSPPKITLELSVEKSIRKKSSSKSVATKAVVVEQQPVPVLSTAVTNPPVKLLLERRRNSSEALVVQRRAKDARSAASLTKANQQKSHRFQTNAVKDVVVIAATT